MENLRVAKIVEQFENTMKAEGINSCDALPESLFLLVSYISLIISHFCI